MRRPRMRPRKVCEPDSHALNDGDIPSTLCRVRAAPFAMSLVLAACASASSSSPGTGVSWPAADRLFHQDPRWLGADGAFSVDLGAGRVLWLFGDSFVGKAAPWSRSDSVMVRNSVAIESGHDPTTAPMKFYWKNGPSSFHPEDGADWFWPMHGAMVGSSLVLFWSKVEAVTGGLGFQAVGWTAERIDDPADPPSAWQPVELKVPANQLGVSVGVSVRVEGGELYAFGEREPGNHDVFLLRWPTSAVAGGDLSSPEWFESGTWKPQASLATAPAPLFSGAPEFSVQPNPKGSGYIYVESTGFGATPISIRRASALAGPWSPAEEVFRPPEDDLPNVFVYAGKSHPEQEGADLVVTYAANSTDFATVVRDDSLYYPRFVKVTLR